ncbi:hypothetical protein ACROYT_G034728 [Oculina patagonica]
MQAADSTCRLISKCRCRYIVLSIFLMVLITLYTIMNLRNYGLYTGNHPLFAAQPCEYLDSKQKDQLLNMTETVHKILDDFGIEHWLMYGSVFGAVRAKGPLAWDNDVDIGFNGSGTFATMDFKEFLSAFEAKGLKVYYKRWFTSNVMKVYSNDLPHIKVDLFALYRYGEWMKRAGLETWIFALNYNLHDTFPARLVEKPCPAVPFGNFKMPVPREGIEIQKYLYPDDWFKEVKPVTCD